MMMMVREGINTAMVVLMLKLQGAREGKVCADEDCEERGWRERFKDCLSSSARG